MESEWNDISEHCKESLTNVSNNSTVLEVLVATYLKLSKSKKQEYYLSSYQVRLLNLYIFGGKSSNLLDNNN